MQRSTTFPYYASTLAAAACAALMSLAPLQAAQINKADYQAGKAKIEADFKADKAACAPLEANAKDVCREEAKAKHKNARAALEYGYTAKPADEKKMMATKIDTAYDVAKEKCDDQSGNAKDVCVKEAKAMKAKGHADMGVMKEAVDASETKRDADLKVAIERCDAMAGDAKSACVSAAKARFGKS